MAAVSRAVASRAVDLLARAKYELSHHHAAVRQAVLAEHGIDVVFDVGAASGSYGAQLRAFGYGGRIVSFEPLPSAFAQLSAVASSDADWVAVDCALGREERSAVLHVAANSDSSSLLPMLEAHRRAAPSVTTVGEQTVAVRRLDDVADALSSGCERPLLKIDAQGYEREVLAGATATLQRAIGLQLELSFVALYEGGMLVDEAIAWAYEQGFALVGIERGFRDDSGRMLQADGVFIRRSLLR